MKSQLYIHGMKLGNVFYVTVESFISLFIYNLLESYDNFDIFFIDKTINKDLICIPIKVDKLNFIYCKETLPVESYSCVLPLINCPKENYITAGLCAVCRCLIKYGKESFQSLLGFKSGCLLAPTETSTWTKFCEIDIINSINKIYNNLKNSNLLEFKLPLEISQFECHLKNPVRIHNKYKLARDLIKIENKIENLNISKDEIKPKIHPEGWIPRINKKKIKKSNNIINNNLDLDHIFCEGPQLTIADLILFNSFYIIIKIFKNNEVDLNESEIPLIMKWFNNIKKINDCKYDLIFNDLYNSDIRNEFILKRSIKIIIDKLENFSLYNDKKCEKNIKLDFTKEVDIKKSLELFGKLNINPSEKNDKTEGRQIDYKWDDVPMIVQPEQGNLSDRTLRKKEQLENMARECIAIAKDNDHIVDFCSGTGHLGILLATKLPNCKIYLVENKEHSLNIAKERIKNLNLNNLYFFQCNLDYFTKKFNIGLSLHACGVATDIVLDICQKQNANFISSPCCYGKIHEMPHIKYPRSKIYNTVLNYSDYLFIAHCADQTHDIKIENCNVEKSLQGEFCMDIIDNDRKLAANELGYKIYITKMIPENCSLKNRMLIGRI